MDIEPDESDGFEDYIKKVLGCDAYERGFSFQPFSRRKLRAPREFTERLLAASFQLVFPLTSDALKQKPIKPRRFIAAVSADFAANSAVAVMVTHNHPEEGIQMKTIINSISQACNLVFPSRR